MHRRRVKRFRINYPRSSKQFDPIYSMKNLHLSLTELKGLAKVPGDKSQDLDKKIDQLNKIPEGRLRYRSNSPYPRRKPQRRQSRSPSRRSPVRTSEENKDLQPAMEARPQ
ncbi:hypothetical protein TNIN_135281 [Trichonephila inaurata madagascariensis]|uniref:Uncharacterized protein n=1 Tax=Trichonephila inaurata madagascariensis TaxID=2747483 RepID=A0A8X6YXK2_9ARAC|nr:hypothetical protein TNIN_135281 [Trichonephila inaurata madagascariensis]